MNFNLLAALLICYQTSNPSQTITRLTFFFFFTNQSLNHKWHVHVKPEGGDTYAAMGERCKSLGGHYNPYEVDLEVSI